MFNRKKIKYAKQILELTEIIEQKEQTIISLVIQNNARICRLEYKNERVRDDMANELRYLKEENRRLKEEINQGIWGKM